MNNDFRLRSSGHSHASLPPPSSLTNDGVNYNSPRHVVTVSRTSIYDTYVDTPVSSYSCPCTPTLPDHPSFQLPISPRSPNGTDALGRRPTADKQRIQILEEKIELLAMEASKAVDQIVDLEKELAGFRENAPKSVKKLRRQTVVMGGSNRSEKFLVSRNSMEQLPEYKFDSLPDKYINSSNTSNNTSSIPGTAASAPSSSRNNSRANTNNGRTPKTPVLPNQYMTQSFTILNPPASPLTSPSAFSSSKSSPTTAIASSSSNSSSRIGSYSSISSSTSTLHSSSSSPSLYSPTNNIFETTAPLHIPPRKPSHQFRLVHEHKQLIAASSRFEQSLDANVVSSDAHTDNTDATITSMNHTTTNTTATASTTPTPTTTTSSSTTHSKNPSSSIIHSVNSSALDLNIQNNVITLTIDTARKPNSHKSHSDLELSPSPRDQRLKCLDVALHSIIRARSLLNDISDQNDSEQ